MIIYYHGTGPQNAKVIRETGFHKGTYLAKHLEDVLHYGGRHVFEVALDRHRIKNVSDWQISTAVRIKPDRIVSYTVYPMEKVKFEDEELREQVFASNK